MPWRNGGVIGKRNLPAGGVASGVWRLSEIESSSRAGDWPLGSIQPTDVTGLALWLDPSDAATIGPTSSGSGTVADNGFVKYLGDKSGNGRHMIQTGADSAAPTLLANSVNGRSVLRFDGTDVLASAFNITLTSQSVFMVLYSDSVTSFARFFTQSDAGSDVSSGHYIPILRNASTTNLGGWSSGAFRAGLTVANGTWATFSAVHSGSVISNQLNNGSPVTSIQSLNKSFTRFQIGANFPGGPVDGIDGRIAETLMYNRAVTATERVAIVQYLTAKWGIT